MPAEIEVAEDLYRHFQMSFRNDEYERIQHETFIREVSAIITAHRAPVPDWDETTIANAGAQGLARALLDDDGRSEMSPGPCADALALVRRLRAQISTRAHTAELLTELTEKFRSAAQMKHAEAEMLADGWAATHINGQAVALEYVVSTLSAMLKHESKVHPEPVE